MYPNTFYRVSIKAHITDEQGKIFVVKENDKNGNSWWGLPGGGLDHGELQTDCLKREINEELGIDDIEIGEIAYSKTFYLDQIDAWMIWIVYKAKLNASEFIFGDGVSNAKYIDPKELENSEDMFERSVFEVAKCIH